MSDRLTRDDVAKVADLARLTLTDAELDTYTEQLGAVLDHAADVAALDLDDGLTAGLGAEDGWDLHLRHRRNPTDPPAENGSLS